MVLGLCDRFKCLPDPGGLWEQDVALVRMLNVVALAGGGEPGG